METAGELAYHLWRGIVTCVPQVIAPSPRKPSTIAAFRKFTYPTTMYPPTWATSSPAARLTWIVVEYGLGCDQALPSRLEVYQMTSGCSAQAVHWSMKKAYV